MLGLKSKKVVGSAPCTCQCNLLLKLPSRQLILIILVESPVAILTTRSSELHAPPATQYTRVDSGLPQQNMYRRFKDTAL
ncbi:hypothetical protein KC19_5G090300 [Ceratodon purpureus]|uniref:Uncharacterized protein n=1 Tax=Ceratodon purpureus TaxID=3225 RepID=A0A8T0I124_CERPU|nr:hypothetical protein KC19_5G090300 [Ceratodon purpureus]